MSTLFDETFNDIFTKLQRAKNNNDVEFMKIFYRDLWVLLYKIDHKVDSTKIAKLYENIHNLFDKDNNSKLYEDVMSYTTDISFFPDIEVKKHAELFINIGPYVN